MKLLHPFMPFITEEIWQHIRSRSTDDAMIVTSWPKFDQSRISQKDLRSFSLVQKMISAIRNIRAEFSVPSKRLLIYISMPILKIMLPLFEIMNGFLRNCRTFHLLTLRQTFQNPKHQPQPW